MSSIRNTDDSLGNTTTRAAVGMGGTNDNGNTDSAVCARSLQRRYAALVPNHLDDVAVLQQHLYKLIHE